MHYIFDVDGTLTPSRSRIDPEFAKHFEAFCDKNNVYLITGSDHEKTYEQLGEICNKVKRVYNCSGSEIWEGSVRVWADEWEPPSELYDTLIYAMRESKWDSFAGKHIEFRSGMINFSVVGRNANKYQRERYSAWDKVTGERQKIASRINSLYNDIVATVGGEISIDIAPKGSDKSQILKDFNPNAVMFFGDKCSEGGNDYPLANALLQNGGTVIAVDNWQETRDFLNLKD